MVRRVWWRWAAVTLAVGACAGVAFAQPRETRVTIPYLVNASTPEALDYAAAVCDISPDGRSMTCRFRQVFITQTSIDPTSCAITTNGYEQAFRREGPARWSSTGAASGECGVVETTTLEDGGSTRWTMRLARRATKNTERAECRASSAEEVYDWKSIKRRLPCTSIQPGALER